MILSCGPVSSTKLLTGCHNTQSFHLLSSPGAIQARTQVQYSSTAHLNYTQWHSLKKYFLQKEEEEHDGTEWLARYRLSGMPCVYFLAHG